jgi:hypothetical protein
MLTARRCSAERVEEAFHLACRHGERPFGAFVDDQHRPRVARKLAHRAQDPDRVGDVVQHLDRHHEVVVTFDRAPATIELTAADETEVEAYAGRLFELPSPACASAVTITASPFALQG